MAQAYFLQGRFSETANTIAQARDAATNDAHGRTRSQLGLARSLRALGDQTGALAAAEAAVRAAKDSADVQKFRSLCVQFMGLHSSTFERLEILEHFYDSLFAGLPRIHSVIDVACGLNPLSLPWMPIAGSPAYYAYDIYKDLIDFIGNFVRLAGGQPHVEARDVLHTPPVVRADLAFVLKNVPCFDQIDRAATPLLLDRLDARYVVISFPRQSLGGTGRFLTEQHATRFAELVQGRKWAVSRMEYKTELVFLIDKTETRP